MSHMYCTVCMAYSVPETTFVHWVIGMMQDMGYIQHLRSNAHAAMWVVHVMPMLLHTVHLIQYDAYDIECSIDGTYDTYNLCIYIYR